MREGRPVVERSTRRSRTVRAIGGLAAALLMACTSLEGLVGGLGGLEDAGIPDAAEAGREAPPPDAPADAPAMPSFRPPVGTYRYVGTGADKLNLPDGGLLKEQLQGPTMTGSVTPLGEDCYAFTLSVSTTHSWSLHFCQRGDRLVETSGQDDQVWMFGTTKNPNLATWRCTPENLILGPTVERDKQAPHLCSGKNTTPADSGFEQGGLLKFLGHEVLAVDGKDVPVVHVAVTRTVTGSTQTGTQELELWLATDTSLPVRGARSSTVTTSAPFFGQLRYSEASEFQIQSTIPSPLDAGAGDSGDAGRDG